MVFEEIQRFKQWWLWMILIGTALIPVYGLFQQVYLGIPFGDNPASDQGLVVFLLIMLAVLALFALSFLHTRIDDGGIHMDFIPFVRKKVSWDQIEKLEVVDYGFAGGWGIRMGSKYGTIYNMSGRKGLAIKRKNGADFLIGSAKPEELESYLRKNRSKYL